jgi:hypothetical protein
MPDPDVPHAILLFYGDASEETEGSVDRKVSIPTSSLRSALRGLITGCVKKRALRASQVVVE